MGAGASALTVPEEIDQEICKRICGDLYNDDLFNSLKDERGFVSKLVFERELGRRSTNTHTDGITTSSSGATAEINAVLNTEEEDAKIKAERELFSWLTDHVHGLHPDNAYKYSKIFHAAKLTPIQRLARKVEKKAKYLTDELEIDEDDADDIIDAMKTAGMLSMGKSSDNNTARSVKSTKSTSRQKRSKDNNGDDQSVSTENGAVKTNGAPPATVLTERKGTDLYAQLIINMKVEEGMDGRGLYEQIKSLTSDAFLVLNLSGQPVKFQCYDSGDLIMLLPKCAPYAVHRAYSLVKGWSAGETCKVYPDDCKQQFVCSPGLFYVYMGNGHWSLKGNKENILKTARGP